MTKRRSAGESQPTSMNDVVSVYGRSAREKLNTPAAKGSPEDQLRSPFEGLLRGMASICGILPQDVVAVGESSLSDLRTRPDYAVVVNGALAGHVELKAPGKGADPRRFREKHDREQWERLRSLPNLLYTDGNEFSLWRSGELVDAVVELDGDVEKSGARLRGPGTLAGLFTAFLTWAPQAPSSAKELARTSASLCRLLRDEVREQLGLGAPALTSLAKDWRVLLFPEATDETFADGYAQAVTFGLLMARARNIPLRHGFERVARELAGTSSLIGAALRLLTDSPENQATLKTALGTLSRVLDAVDWGRISKGGAEAWLYFYEDFLDVYDRDLRKQTGSYYTPPQVVGAMVRLVDDVLRGPRFGQTAGLASPTVTVADPATGTGTFVLGVLRAIAERVRTDEGAGAMKAAIEAAVRRIVAFELQLGPFAVAQLRILAELVELTGSTPAAAPRMFVTNTLGNPDDDEGWIPGILAPIAQSRRDANKIKRDEPITVVIGNPPYKEKAKGRGGWVEGGNDGKGEGAPLSAWMPPPAWGVGAHAKHLRNLYIYFWRWATWKVFDHPKQSNAGIVCFITVAGFLSGPGFQRMRDYLRRTCDDIWVVDCSPEGHQPDVPTRVFQGVQQPVCIVLASRSPRHQEGVPASVWFTALPSGVRELKFAALADLTLEGAQWRTCPTEGREPFLPASNGPWAQFPALEDYFLDNSSGVMPGRTWVISPDPESLVRRWGALQRAPASRQEDLFQPHMSNGRLGDRHMNKVVADPLAGFEPRTRPLAADDGPCVPPIQYAFRSFDRQWIIPDNRLINRPNPGLWAGRSSRQIYITALSRHAPTGGPALSCCAEIPDLHHYKGSFGGRAFPLWLDATCSRSNVRPGILRALSESFKRAVSDEEIFAYVVGIASHPGYIARFRADLATPGLRIPLTADVTLFGHVVEIGKRAVWLHTFGERWHDARADRPHGPPRLPAALRPNVSKAGAIPADADSIGYDQASQRLLVGSGFVDRVPAAVWSYEVSGKRVLAQWFSYRRRNRERPVMGDRRPPSELTRIQPDSWLSEYTTELLNLLNVLGLLVMLEPEQSKLLDAVCASKQSSVDDLRAAGALVEDPTTGAKRDKEEGWFST